VISIERTGKYPWMNIHVFMDISLQFSILPWISLWISMDFYGYPCMNLLWILVLGWSFLFLNAMILSLNMPHKENLHSKYQPLF